MLLVANSSNTKWCKKPEKWLKHLAHVYSSESTQWELSNEYQQYQRLDDFEKSLRPCTLGESTSRSIGRVKNR